MKGPLTKRLFLGLGLGVLLGSCQPVQYTTKEEGSVALQTLREAPSPVYQPQPSLYHGPFVAPFSLTAAVATSSSVSDNPYARFTAKDYQFKPLESPSKQPASLETVLTLPYVPVYSTAVPPVSFEPYLLTERRERRLDRAYFPSQEEQQFAQEEGWFVHDSRPHNSRPRDNRDKELDERSMPLGKLGHALKRLLEKSNNSVGYVLRRFSGIADGPTQYLFSKDWKTKFNMRVGTKKTGIYLSLKPSDDFKFTLGYETSANIGGKEGDAAFFLTFEYAIGPHEQ